MPRVTLVVGDKWADGHGRTEHISYDHTLPTNGDLCKAYAKGCEMLGYDVTKRYDDDKYIPVEAVAKARELGLDLYNECIVEGDDEQGYCLNEGRWSYARMWMEVAMLGTDMPGAQYTPAKTDEIEIGGYDFFH